MELSDEQVIKKHEDVRGIGNSTAATGRSLDLQAAIKQDGSYCVMCILSCC